MSKMEVLLSCPLCLKPHFEGVDDLRTSLISAATTNISCPVCNKLFLGLDKLTIHLFSHISNTKFVKDDSQVEMDIGNNEIGMSNYNNKSTEEDRNMFSKGGERIEVNGSERDVEMLSHEDNNRLKNSNDVVCDICSFQFSDETILDLHQKLLHQTVPDNKTGKYSYHCHLCSKQFKMRGSLMVHLRVAHFGFIQSNKRNRIRQQSDNNATDLSSERAQLTNNNADSICYNIQEQAKSDQNKTSTATSLQQSPPLVRLENRKNLNGSLICKPQDNKQWECEICLKSFTTKYFLKKHKRLHTGEMPYYCSQCNKYFTFQQSYHKHMLYHSDEKPHICTECGRAFKELSTLHNHERIHSGERPFSCETCGKCFRQRVSYLVHRRIHTGVMPYKCTACNKSFRYKVSQRSHKCTVNPPGCVVRTPDLVENLIRNHNALDENISQVSGYRMIGNVSCGDPKCSTVDISNNSESTVNQSSKDEDKIPNIETENNSHANILNVSLLPNPAYSCKQQNIQEFMNYGSEVNNGSSPGAISSDNTNSDFFTLILSPVLSDVQSLCLSNYNESQTQNNNRKQNHFQSSDSLETINEESFKELLYGPSTK